MRTSILMLAALLSLALLSACSKDGPPPPLPDLAPIVLNNSAATTDGTAIELDVLRGASDPEGSALTIVGATVDNPALGTVTIAVDGKTITFTPTPGQTGTVMITYTVQDASSKSSSGVITMQVASSATLVAISGNNQSDITGRTLAPFVVEVQDNLGMPLPGAYVNFVVTNGAGTLSTNVVQIANALGRVSTSYTLGATGANSVNATMTGATNTPLTFNATSLATLQITSPSFASGTTGGVYAGGALTASGGVPPYTFARISGDSIPAGLSLGANGVLSGTPAAGSEGSYNFSIQVTDSASNVSTSGVSLSVVDGIAPNAPSNLVTAYSGVNNTINLTFNAPGDDGATGTATSYQIRTSTSPINDVNDFNGATVVTNSATPFAAGMLQSVQVPLNWYSGTHHFALRAVDNGGNLGTISSNATADTSASATFGSTSHDFGSVSVGGSANNMFTITNTSSLVKLELTSIGLATATSFGVLLGGGSASVAPQATHTVSVNFSPASAAAFNDTLSVTHNASSSPSPVTYALSGTGTNSGPSIGSATASPSTVAVSATTTLTVIASDANSSLPGTNDIASVTLDLTAFGGSATQAMTFGGMSGNAQTGTYSFMLAIPGAQTAQAYMIPVTVKDNANTTVNGNIALTVTAAPNAAPTITLSVFAPATQVAGMMSEIQIRVNDADSDFGNTIDDITSVVANLSTLGGSANQTLTRTSTPTNTTGEYTMMVDTTSLAVNTYSVAVTATDSANQMVMANVMLMVTNAAPTVTSATFTPASVIAGTMSTLNVTVSDLNSTMAVNNVSTVTVNLTAIGGAAAQALTFGTRPTATTATYSAVVSTTGAAAQAYNLTVTATDAATATGTAMAALTITGGGNSAPNIASSNSNPTTPQQGVNVTLTVNVTDANSTTPATNDIASVVIDLTDLGLAPNVAMTYNAGASTGTTSVYNHTFSTYGLATGTFSLPVVATDTASASDSDVLALTITETFGSSPELLYEYPQAASNGSMAYTAINHKMVYIFSKAVDPASVIPSGGTATVLVQDGFLKNLSASFATNVAGMNNRILIIDTTTDFQSSTQIGAFLIADRIASPGTGIKGTDGNQLINGHQDAQAQVASGTGPALIFGWAGTATNDVTAPTIASRSPASSSSNNAVRVAIQITFSEFINPATLAANFTVTDGSGAVGGSVHIDPSDLKKVWFAPSRDYSGTVNVNVNGVQDLGGNAAAGTAYTFTAAGDTTAPTITNLTVNDIPDEINGSVANGGGSAAGGIMRVGRNGFTIDISYTDVGGAGISLTKNDLSIKANVGVTGMSGAIGANQELIGEFGASDVLITRSKATLLVPNTLSFPNTGTVTLSVQVKDAANNQSTAVTYSVEARDATNAKIPFEAQEMWHFVFDRDHESIALNTGANSMTTTGFDGSTFFPAAIATNSVGDMDDSLLAHGLRSTAGNAQVNSTGALSMNVAVSNWVKNRIIYYNYRYYGLNVPLTDSKSNPHFEAVLNSNPTNASDGANIHFQSTAAAATNGSQARMAFGGVYQQGVLGNAAFDVPNNSHNEDNGVATSETDRGVFTTYDAATNWDGSPDANGSLFRSKFYPTSPFAAANGTTIGSSADDPFIVDPAQDPTTFMGARLARYKTVLAAMDAFALNWARVAAHEVGHSVGLIVDGAPAAGMYGNQVAFFPGSTSGHVDLDSFYPGSGQNVMSPSGGMAHSFSRFTAFNKLALAYLLHQSVVN